MFIFLFRCILSHQVRSAVMRSATWDSLVILLRGLAVSLHRFLSSRMFLISQNWTVLNQTDTERVNDSRQQTWQILFISKSCEDTHTHTYEGISNSFRTGHLERELQMVQLSAIKCSCITILLVSIVYFAAITLCVASQRLFIVVSVYFVIDSVRTL